MGCAPHCSLHAIHIHRRFEKQCLAWLRARCTQPICMLQPAGLMATASFQPVLVYVTWLQAWYNLHLPWSSYVHSNSNPEGPVMCSTACCRTHKHCSCRTSLLRSSLIICDTADPVSSKHATAAQVNAGAPVPFTAADSAQCRVCPRRVTAMHLPLSDQHETSIHTG